MFFKSPEGLIYFVSCVYLRLILLVKDVSSVVPTIQYASTSSIVPSPSLSQMIICAPFNILLASKVENAIPNNNPTTPIIIKFFILCPPILICLLQEKTHLPPHHNRHLWIAKSFQ